jgi:pimeloyl-ACP methyl ester carboxylesterase
LAEAERRGNRKAIEQLRAIGSPPYSASSLWVERTWLQRFEGNLRPRALWNLGRVLLGGPESSILDLPSLLSGFRFSIDAMWAETSRLNLLDSVPALTMPVFFFLGRRDRWVPGETSLAYFDALNAPVKKLVWFEESGHEPFVDEPDKFNRLMVQLVRPASLNTGGLSLAS